MAAVNNGNQRVQVFPESLGSSGKPELFGPREPRAALGVVIPIATVLRHCRPKWKHINTFPIMRENSRLSVINLPERGHFDGGTSVTCNANGNKF